MALSNVCPRCKERSIEAWMKICKKCYSEVKTFMAEEGITGEADWLKDNQKPVGIEVKERVVKKPPAQNQNVMVECNKRNCKAQILSSLINVCGINLSVKAVKAMAKELFEVLE